FTSSDSYHQVPLQLLRDHEVTMITKETSEVPEDYEPFFREIIRLPTDKIQFASQSEERAHRLHEEVSLDGVVTSFDMLGLISGWRINKRSGIPWIPVCEDYPFGERYKGVE